MKNPKTLKRRHKIFLNELGLDPNDYLIVMEEAEDYIFYQKSTGQIVCIRR